MFGKARPWCGARGRALGSCVVAASTMGRSPSEKPGLLPARWVASTMGRSASGFVPTLFRGGTTPDRSEKAGLLSSTAAFSEGQWQPRHLPQPVRWAPRLPSSSRLSFREPGLRRTGRRSRGYCQHGGAPSESAGGSGGCLRVGV